MRRALVVLSFLILLTACNTAIGRNVGIAAGTTEITMVDLPTVESVTTPEEAETLFFNVARIVKRAADAGADPVAVQAYKLAARDAHDAIGVWRQTGNRPLWLSKAPQMIIAAHAVPGVK